MIIERMVELQILITILTNIEEINSDGSVHSIWGNDYDLDKMKARANDLMKEFVQPYVMNYHSKE